MENNNFLYIVAIVAIVAIVSLMMVSHHSTSNAISADQVGQAYGLSRTCSGHCGGETITYTCKVNLYGVAATCGGCDCPPVGPPHCSCGAD